MCQNLIQIITHFSSANFREGKPAPRFILNILCTAQYQTSLIVYPKISQLLIPHDLYALAYLTIHTHVVWPSLITDITQAFQGDLEQALCLLRILRYMAEDCDNEQIVVEESVKESYFYFLDSHARQYIFQNIFNQWALNIPNLPQQSDPNKVIFLQNRLMDTFLSWIRLSLPTEVYENMLVENSVPKILLIQPG